MNEGVGLEVARVAEDSDEEVFGGNVHVERAADDQAREGDAVGHSFEGWTGAAECRGRNPLSAPPVDDEGEGEVGGCYERHAEVDGFGVVFGLAHLGNYGEECGGGGAGDEDCC